MILNNYANYLASIQSHNYSTVSVPGTFIDTNGSTFSSMGSDGNSGLTRMDTDMFVDIGEGDNEYTSDAYAITSPLSGVSASMTSTVGAEGNKVVRTYTITGSNSNSEEKTITEVAIGKSYNMYVQSSWQYVNFLFAITKLSQPVTVPAGASYTITLRWEG